MNDMESYICVYLIRQSLVKWMGIGVILTRRRLKESGMPIAPELRLMRMVERK